MRSASLLALCCCALLATIALPAAAQHISHESLVVLRINDGVEQVLHFHGVTDHGHEVDLTQSSYRAGRHPVHMHTNSPMTDVSLSVGDKIDLVHSAFPDSIATVTAPPVGDWFTVALPHGSNDHTAALVLRFMLVDMGNGDAPLLITTDYDEWVADDNENNLAEILPQELKLAVRDVPAKKRAEVYKAHLGDRFPKLPVEKDL